MMKPVARVNGEFASALLGIPVFDMRKVLWNGLMLTASVTFAVPLFSWSAFALFLSTTYVTLLVGHSVGMHRMMIHRTFECSKPVERLLIYIGVLVGVAGPFGILRVHDTRDWAQRQAECHEFFAHTRSLPRDLIWQLAYRFSFVRPPEFVIEPHFARDPFYIFLERTWQLHQIPVALVAFALGGWSWVIWSVCMRVLVSTIGHWTITYFCHRAGEGRWHIPGAAVQACNLPGLGMITYGECWHNHHHAFPESARIGLDKGQLDPGWWLIAALERAGVAKNVGLPRAGDRREDLVERKSMSSPSAEQHA